MSFIIYKQNL